MAGRAATIAAGSSLLAALALGPAPAAGAGDALGPAQVTAIEKSVDVGLKALRFEQREDGSWADSPIATALVARALMESHRRYTEEDGPFVRRALAYLAAQAGPGGAFGRPPSPALTALASQVLGRSRREDRRALAAGARAWLEATLATAAAGAPLPAGDAALALEALGPRDERLSPAVWRPAADEETADARALIVLPLLLHAEVPAADPERRRALAALGRVHASAGAASGRAADLPYWLVRALEATARDGLLESAGVGPAWRRELAEALIARQEADGLWPAAAGDRSPAGRILASAYAVLALERLLGA